MENLQYYSQKYIKKYPIEIILITIALCITLSALGIYLSSNSTATPIQPIYAEENVQAIQTKPAHIFVEISGSVEKPDVYEVSSSARLKDIIVLAGGLTMNADKNFVARNFNQAKKLADQEKIHIPSLQETSSHIFSEKKRTLEYLYSTNQTIESQKTPKASSNSSKININSASITELDKLPGIGKTTAQKIIDNRPYTNTEELLDRQVVTNAIFERIKDGIDL